MMLMMQMGAGGGDIIALAGVNYYGTRTGVACTVQYVLTSTALEQYIDENSSTTTIGTWCTPTGNAPLYQCKMTLNTGTFTSGTTGSFLALSSTRTWVVTQSVLGVKNVNATIEISDIATGTVRATATVDLTAERA